ncbi:hypothetical protein GOP47_0000940 [Adiantum capillus-veneris]|uniref:Uncharacterized protein n=1 Tax=Adiantum capillus-veneris TaxID=13818 RepID=A0A9D4VFP1_ADICA|nr:hypothetical protein GOP47_0000940 [Adiantum capillus-veneris]
MSDRSRAPPDRHPIFRPHLIELTWQDREVIRAGGYLIPCQLEHMILQTKPTLCQTRKWDPGRICSRTM